MPSLALLNPDVQDPAAPDTTIFAPDHFANGQLSPKKGRTRRDRLERYAELLAKANGLNAMLADPAGYLLYVMTTGRDPLEKLIDRVDGAQSPFKSLLGKVAEVLEQDKEPSSRQPTIPNVTPPPVLVDKNGNIIHEALEERLKERGWVPLKMRLAIGKVLMPFVHHRLASIEVTGAEGAPIKWQEAASKIALSGPGIRGVMENLAKRAAADMGTQSDSHIIKSPAGGSSDSLKTP